MKRALHRLTLLAGLAWGALCASNVAYAQSVVTNIQPTGVGSLGTGTTVAETASVTTIDGGALSGANLFHSFDVFTLGGGDTAQWIYSAGDPSAIERVINRIIGGTPSTIDGMIDSSALPNADFYFINPAGVMFGQNAQVNVPGAFFASTAQQVVFTDGAVWSATMEPGSTLSAASPASFGFLGGQGDIQLVGASLQNNSRVHLSAGAVTMTNAGITVGSLSVVSPVYVDLRAMGSGPATLSLDPLATSSGDGALSIDASVIGMFHGGNFVWGGLTLEGGLVSIHGSDLSVLNTPIVIHGQSSINLENSIVFMQGGAGGRGIVLQAPIVTANNSFLQSFVVSAPSGSPGPGPITIEGGRIDLVGTRVRSLALGSADAGTITLRAHDVNVLAGSLLDTSTSGDADAGDLVLDGANITLRESWVALSTSGAGDGGTFRILVSDTALIDQTRIELSSLSSAVTAGRGGDLAIHGDGDAVLTIDPGFSVGITADVQGGAPGTVGGGSIVIDGFSSVALSRISTETRGGADAGQITISGGVVSVGEISALTYGAGDAGQISVSADDTLTVFSSLIAESGAAGDGGRISLTAPNIILDSPSIRSGASWSGAGGSISIYVSQSLTGTAGIEAASRSAALTAGPAGSITILGDGDASFDFSAGSIRASVSGGFGTAPQGAISITGFSEISFTNAFVVTDTAGRLNAGDITISGGTVSLRDTRVDSSTIGRGDAGDIFITASGALDITDGSIIFAGTSGLGRGGDIVLRGATIDIEDSSAATITFGTGNAGLMRVIADERVLLSASALSTESTRSPLFPGVAGGSGSIEVTAPNVQVLDSTIVSSSANASTAGDIHVVADEVVIEGAAARVASENTSSSAGMAGSIRIDAGYIALGDGAEISTNSNNGAAGDITLMLPTDGLLLLLSDTAPASITTSSGPGQGGRITIASPLAIISNGGEILALGQQGGANISIGGGYYFSSFDRVNRIAVDGALVFDAQATDPLAGAEALELAFLNAGDVLANQCATQRAGEASRLTYAELIAPIDVQPSPLAAPAFYAGEAFGSPAGAIAGGCMSEAMQRARRQYWLGEISDASAF